MAGANKNPELKSINPKDAEKLLGKTKYISTWADLFGAQNSGIEDLVRPQGSFVFSSFGKSTSTCPSCGRGLVIEIQQNPLDRPSFYERGKGKP